MPDAWPDFPSTIARRLRTEFVLKLFDNRRPGHALTVVTHGTELNRYYHGTDQW